MSIPWRFRLLLVVFAVIFFSAGFLRRPGDSALKAGPVLSRKAVPPAFAQLECLQCHAYGFPRTSQIHGTDWYYAYFWNPKFMIPYFLMPSYRKEFKQIEATVSPATKISPSGEKVYFLQRTPELGKLFTFNPKKLIYLYPTEASGRWMPDGAKAFTPEAAWEGKIADGAPVVWVSSSPGKISPGSRLLLIVPGKSLSGIVPMIEKNRRSNGFDWLSPVPSVSGSVPDVAEGKKIYQEYCASCHGAAGDGNGPAALFLNPKPRNFASGEFKLKTTGGDDLPTDEDLNRTIANGMQGTAMPSFRNMLSPVELQSVAAYVKQFAVDSSTGKNLFEAHPPQNVVSVMEPDWLRNSKKVKQGKKLYFGKAQCQDCHGPGPKSLDHLPHGDGKSASVLIDDWGYPIHPADLSGGIFKRGDSPREIYLTMTTGMSGTPMPSYQDNLTEEERWEIVAYVISLRPLPPARKK